MKPVILRAKVLRHDKLGPQYYRLVLSAGVLRGSQPGQFLMIRVGRSDQPLLRRPLSIHAVAGNALELLYEVAGEGTRLLTKRKPGEYLDVLGPLGNGFKLPKSKQSTAILVAGGMGVAPLVFLAQKIKEHKGLVLIGGRTAGAILCEKEFQKQGFSVTIATDDGSCGFHGRVTALLEKELKSMAQEPRAKKPGLCIYGCGPKPMLKEVARISCARKIPAQVSLEAHMACGIGACLGCAVQTTSGYQRVCKDGPVFDIEELRW